MGFLDRLLSRRTYDTLFGPLHVICMPNAQGERVRIMELAGTFQSASLEGERWAELPFEYFRGFDALFQAELGGHSMDRVLLLGGGGFAWPKHALTTRKHLSLDVVEVDPCIVEIARKHFYLDRLEEELTKTAQSSFRAQRMPTMPSSTTCSKETPYLSASPRKTSLPQSKTA